MSKNCQTIHILFNGMKKHSFPFNEQEIPENGIYILFEKGEFATLQIELSELEHTQNITNFVLACFSTF